MSANGFVCVVAFLTLLAIGGCPSTKETNMPFVAGDAVGVGTADTEVGRYADVRELPQDYDAFVDRIRAGECNGLGARIGTCGRWLVVIESHIDTYREWYFDPDTRRLVAEHVSDPMIDIEEWTNGSAACGEEEFVQREFIVCGSGPE